MIKLVELVKQIVREEKRDRCLRIADRKYDKPSAYKSGAVVRCRKGNIWKDLKENQKLDQLPKGKIFDDAKNIEGIFKRSKHSWSEVIEAYELNRQNQRQATIDIDSIRITQPSIQANKVMSKIEKIGKLPLIDVVEFEDGERALYDGHHRLTANWALGNDRIKVNLIKLDSTLKENQTSDIISSTTSKKYRKYFNTIGEYLVIEDKVSLLDNNREIGYIETVYISSESVKGDSIADQKIEWRVDKPIVVGVYLEPNYRGKGLGERLYDEMKSIQNKKGFNLYKSHDLTSHGRRMWNKFKERGLVKVDKRGDYLAEDESLHKWFKRQGTPGKGGGWVDCNAPIRKDGKVTGYKSCGRKEGEERSKYPACRPTAARCKDKGKGKTWGKTK
jgi:GNAT superfamily N-acetyltransferase/uncharacterized ParB-like nuclease family protein